MKVFGFRRHGTVPYLRHENENLFNFSTDIESRWDNCQIRLEKS